MERKISLENFIKMDEKENLLTNLIDQVLRDNGTSREEDEINKDDRIKFNIDLLKEAIRSEKDPKQIDAYCKRITELEYQLNPIKKKPDPGIQIF